MIWVLFTLVKRKSKALHRQLRWLLRLTFCDQKVSKKSSATSPPCFAGSPAMLSFAGSQRTRCAQTPLALHPANLPLLGGSQAHQRQLQNQKNLSRVSALPHKSDRGSHKNCRNISAGEPVVQPDCQQRPVYKPRKAAEGTERIGKHERSPQANSTSIVRGHCGNAVLKRDFLVTFLSQDTKKSLASAAEGERRKPLTFKLLNHFQTQHHKLHMDVASLHFMMVQP